MSIQLKIFYRQIFEDLTIEDEENEELISFFAELNPPPDLILKCRALAFQIGSEFLSEEDNDMNIIILKCINSIVHVIEHQCLTPKALFEEEEEENEMDFEAEFETIYRSIYDNKILDEDECDDFINFLSETNLPPQKFSTIRALAIRIGSEYLSEECDVEENTNLFKSINAVVHHVELRYLQPNSFVLNFDALPSCEDMPMEEAVQQLWELDVNRLVPDEEYYLNIQEGKKPYYKTDIADEPLFSFVDSKQLRRSTYKSFIALLDNYSADVTEEDVENGNEEEEVSYFLDCILQTGPMQFCHQYLLTHNADNTPESLEEFKDLLHSIWFEKYSRARGSSANSCGFEHIFVGEIKNDEVSGFHNWIQFYIEEVKGNANYKGYIKPRNNYEEDITDSNDHVLTLQFDWNGVEKFVGTMFIGVSPEFEMALYTLCYLLDESNGEYEFSLNTGTDLFLLQACCHQYHGKIGSCFVKALQHEE